jgi:hypothetical protein
LACADGQLQEFLQRHLPGFRLLAAPDAAAARRLAVEERALAILDDAGEPVPAAAEGTPVPLIRLPLPHGDRLAAAFGATAYLVKPLARARLMATLAGLPGPIRSVLVVDDDPRFARLLARMVETARLPVRPAVVIAHNGREALERLARSMPDLVLLDLVVCHG